MVIVSKDRTSLANMAYVANIYIASDWSIKANMAGNTSMMKMGAYASEKDAEYALRYLTDAIKSGKDAICMPLDDRVRELIALEKMEYHRIDGKKTKGHGGS